MPPPSSFVFIALIGTLGPRALANKVQPQRARADCGPSRASCVLRLSEGSLSPGGVEHPVASAWATYVPAGQSGWPQIEVTTGSAEQGRPVTEKGPEGVKLAESLQLEAYAAGLLEGYLTCEDIAAYSSNARGTTKVSSEEALDFINSQDKYYRREARWRASKDDYWQAVAMLVARFDGLLRGYALGCPYKDPMTKEDLLLLQLDGDLFDIMVAYPQAEESFLLLGEWETAASKPLPLGRRRPWKRSRLRCSALIKLLLDKSDIFFGHDTWDSYAVAGPRLFKTYKMAVRRGGHLVPHVNVFSSSPGYLSSVDDYYTLAGTSQLAVMETSLNVNSLELYEALTPETVPCWIRSQTANMLAEDGRHWTDLFARYHSGTYNNQWMVLDLKRFSTWRLGEVDTDLAPEGLLWIAEEIPGYMATADMSARLVQDGYWASYNVAYFPKVRRLMDEWSSWEKDPRAILFRELQGSVKSIEDMQAVMGWNDYMHSRASDGDPGNAIMARNDLQPPEEATADGGIDSKISSYLHQRRSMSTFARVGPTHDSLPPFCWNATQLGHLISMPHEGHPECFNYTWERMWLGRTDPLIFT